MRKRILVLLTAALLLTGAIAAGAIGKPPAKKKKTPTAAKTTFNAVLGTKQEVPAETGAKPTAGGKFTAHLSGGTLTWNLTFAHLTGKASAAHIHLGAKGKPGGVIVSICGPCTSPAKGSQKVTNAVIKDLRSGHTYVNVHTMKNPNGEIRGQIG
ncbi:MAG TPA: CHRD domain-containing protein [Gaiellaceae bacterium]|jgi:hypothetical protein